MPVGTPFRPRHHKSICPKCGERYGVLLYYGQPRGRILQKIQIGDCKFGGPEKPDNAPDKCCMKCGHTWLVNY